MEKNDYVKIHQRVVKVIDPKNGIVRDVITMENREENLHSCFIPITKEILIACGFKKDTGNVYYATLQDDNKTCVISCEFLPLKREYLMTLTDNSGMATLKKDMIILSELQDWVRENAGFELNVDEGKLVAAVK